MPPLPVEEITGILLMVVLSLRFRQFQAITAIPAISELEYV
jgi:hypothetical protein